MNVLQLLLFVGACVPGFCHVHSTRGQRVLPPYVSVCITVLVRDFAAGGVQKAAMTSRAVAPAPRVSQSSVESMAMATLTETMTAARKYSVGAGVPSATQNRARKALIQAMERARNGPEARVAPPVMKAPDGANALPSVVGREAPVCIS